MDSILIGVMAIVIVTEFTGSLIDDAKNIVTAPFRAVGKIFGSGQSEQPPKQNKSFIFDW